MEELKRYTTFRIGGYCDRLIVAKSEAELIDNADALILGNGSNVLLGRHIGGTVVINRANAILPKGDGLVYAQSGATLAEVNAFAFSNGLSGLEWAAGIPASVGGAALMNAGARGSCVAEHSRSIRVFRGGAVINLDCAELKPSYRNGGLNRGDVVLGVLYKLKPEKPEASRDAYANALKERRRKQPTGLSAGCVFKNPEGGAAGKLIDECGLKGLTVGDARVSEKHANFIINKGDATFADVRDLMYTVMAQVYEKTGIKLQEEIKVYGD